MKTLFFVSLVLLVSLSARANDPKIAALVAGLSTKPMWSNGTFPILGLPADASIPQVVDRCLGMTSFDAGYIKQYEIRATEKVTFKPHPDEVTAVLITSDLGDKVILMRYKGDRVGWWTRVFDAK